MSRKVRAFVEPSLLEWARESSGYSIEDIAKKFKKPPEVIKSWEIGEQDIYMGQLRILANYVKRPISDFFLPFPPKEDPIPHDFRRAPGQIALTYSPQLRRQLRFAQERRNLAISFYEDLGERPPAINVATYTSNNAEEQAILIRKWLDIPDAGLGHSNDRRVEFNKWRFSIEGKGILIFQFADVSTDEGWGFSIANKTLPVIGINKKLSYSARIFTLLHELGHVFLGRSGICDIDDSSPRGAQELKNEVTCNQIAASTLMPKEQFLSHHVISSHNTSDLSWQEDEISKIAGTFSASREAVIVRLKSFNLTTNDFYLRMRSKYKEEWVKTIEERKKQNKGKKYKRNMPQESISNLGEHYVKLVLNSYHGKKITLADASEYLGVQTGKIANVEEKLRYKKRV